MGKKDATKHDIKEDFLLEVIEIWVNFNFRDSFPSKHYLCSGSSIIWNNSLVIIANRPFFFTSTGQKLVSKYQIEDLVHDDFKVITYGEFREKYCLSASFLEFYGVTSAIRSEIENARWKGSGIFGAKTDCSNQAD